MLNRNWIYYFLPIIVACFLNSQLFAQVKDFGWWNAKHNWDGHTSWKDYVRISPGYMGPNAFKIPDLESGNWVNSVNLAAVQEFHYSHGDQTLTERWQAKYTYDEKIQIQLDFVPIEIYQTDTFTRDLRRARQLETKGISVGDLYFGTVLSIYENSRWQVLLGMHTKTASGNNLENARFTDTPGYYFSNHLVYNTKIGERSLRFYGLLGFYVWQTNYNGYLQNDAIAYGLGVLHELEDNKLELEFSGFTGYIHKRAQIAARSELLPNRDIVQMLKFSYLKQIRNLQIGMAVSQGFSYYPYTSFMLFVNRTFRKI